MKKRLTRHVDEFPCRIEEYCSAEEWMREVTDTPYIHWNKGVCDDCPFMKYINKLAEYEDMEEKMEDDLK